MIFVYNRSAQSFILSQSGDGWCATYECSYMYNVNFASHVPSKCVGKIYFKSHMRSISVIFSRSVLYARPNRWTEAIQIGQGHFPGPDHAGVTGPTFSSPNLRGFPNSARNPKTTILE